MICGLDLGQTTDRSALVALKVTPGEASGKNVYDVMFLERFHVGTPYPEIGKHVAHLFSRAPLAGGTLAIDGTGVGRGVVDFFKLLGLNADVHPVTITGGLASSKATDGYWHIAKQNLVSAAMVALQTRRINFAPDLPDLRVLKSELSNFRVKISKAAHELYEAREGEHDDMVLAVAMVLWFADNTFTGPWEFKPDPRARSVWADIPEDVWDVPLSRNDPAGWRSGR